MAASQYSVVAQVRAGAPRAHGKFVAPSTNTPVSSLPTPCICTRNSVLIRRLASLSPSPLVPHSESTSSMNTIDGLFSRARVNSCLTRRSLSPIHLLTRSEEDTLKKVDFASVATAFAKNDLPVPGGPYNKIPRQGVRLPTNRCGNLMGRITASFSESLAASRPATSSHLTLGVSDRIAEASPALSFFVSASSSVSSSFLLTSRDQLFSREQIVNNYFFPEPPPPPPSLPFALTACRCRFSSACAIWFLSFSARSRYLDTTVFS